MKYTSFNRGLPAGNPIANVFVIVAGALIIGVSVLLGVVAFVVLGSILAILAAVIGLRAWWFRRRFGKARRPESADAGQGGVIEGEYRVISDERDSEHQR